MLDETTLSGSSFGAASTLVAQMGILLGMVVGGQPQSALVVASAASAVSGSFGDAFSMFVSESTAKRNESAQQAAVAVLLSKLGLGAIFVLIYTLVPDRTLVVPLAIILSMSLLFVLSNVMVVDKSESVLPTFMRYVSLTVAVVAVTSAFGYGVKRYFSS